jgi:hypothetical protein
MDALTRDSAQLQAPASQWKPLTHCVSSVQEVQQAPF